MWGDPIAARELLTEAQDHLGLHQRPVCEPMAGEELVSRTLDALAGDAPPAV